MFNFFSIGSSVSDGNRVNSLELQVVWIQLHHEEQCIQFIVCKRSTGFPVVISDCGRYGCKTNIKLHFMWF